MEINNLLLENARRRHQEDEERESAENQERLERRQMRENEMNEYQEKIDNLHLKFIMEKMTIVEGNLELNIDSISLQNGHPNVRVVTNTIRRDDEAIFLALHKPDLWKHLADSTNIELQAKLSQNKIKKKIL